MLRRRWRAAVLVAAIAGALLPVGVAAHPYLVSADPAAGATVPTSPAHITIIYTEELDGPYSSVSLVGPDGQERKAEVSSSGSRLTATLPPLDAGTWVVNWTVVGDDGHRVVGDFTFNVAHPSANAAAASLTTGYGSAGDVSPLELVGRTVLTVLTVLLAGLLLLGFVVLPRDPQSRPVAGARLARLRTAVWLAQLVVVAALAGLLIRWNGVGTLLSSLTGKLIVLRGLLTLALAPAVLDGGALAAGRRVGRGAAAYGATVAAALLGALALSGHALAAPDHRTIELLVLGVHLLSISLWVGAIVAVVAGTVRIPSGTPATRRLRTEAGRFTPMVAVCIVVMLASGIYNAGVNLRSVGQLGSSSYGRLLDAKLCLVLLMILSGLAGAVWRMRAGDAPPRTHRRGAWLLGRRAYAAEAAVAVLVLSAAGVLAQSPNPVSFPYPSQASPRPAGTPLFATSNGTHLIPVTVSPGLPGRNRVVSTVERSDDNDLPVPLGGVTSIDLEARCDCSAAPVSATLSPVTGGPWLSADVDLASGRWTFVMRPHLGTTTEAAATGTGEIVPLSLPDQVLLGIAGDLSGSDGQSCQDRAIGVQTAAVEGNEGALAGGDVIRVIAVDTHETGPAQAVARLAEMHVALLAAPCGDPSGVAAIAAAAERLHLPVVGALEAGGHAPGVWSTAPDPAAEGAALADQVATLEHGRSALVLAGHSPAEAEEADATTIELTRLGLPHRRMAIDSAPPAVLAEHVRELNPDSVVMVAAPDAALPVILAFGNLTPEWAPAHSAEASSELMSNVLVSAAGKWVSVGRIHFASEVDPDDVSGISYATRLLQWYGGRRPTLDGLRGYVAGWVIDNLLRDAGSDRSAAHLTAVLGTDFRDFVFGQSYALRWVPRGGGADRLAFFTTVFINPFTNPLLPASTNHAGIFLKAGSFVRLSEYRTIGSTPG